MKKLFSTTVLQISLYLSLSLSAWSDGPLYISEHLMDWNRGALGSTYQEWTFDSTPVLVNPEYRDHSGQLCSPNDPNSQLKSTYLYPDRYNNSNGMPLLRIVGFRDSFDGYYKGLEFSNGQWWTGIDEYPNFFSSGLISTFPNLMIPDYPLVAPIKVWVEVGYTMPENARAAATMDPPYVIDRIVGVEIVGQNTYINHVTSFGWYNLNSNGLDDRLHFCINNQGSTGFVVLDYVICDTLTGTNRIDQLDFAALTFYWGDLNCDSGQPCKVADWYADGKIDIYDLIWLAENWLLEI
jgi:hypothetical protein